jgi:hypothetical protein
MAGAGAVVMSDAWCSGAGYVSTWINDSSEASDSMPPYDCEAIKAELEFVRWVVRLTSAVVGTGKSTAGE